MGRPEEALQMVEEALRRTPVIVDEHLANVGAAYLLAGKPAEAIAPLKQYISRYPNILGAHLVLASAYNPKFSLDVYKERMPIKDAAVLERGIAALRKAGLK
jgi:Tfp pilus assembly protein PilF